jgi:hypothetical protein
VRRQTSRDYGAPHRPALVRALDALWAAVGFERPVDADRWIAEAERRAGVAFEGDRAPFEVLAESLREEGGLTPVGRAIVEARLVGAIRGRLEVEATAAAPAPVTAPVAIVGLQRTGTTFLQRLLGAHPSLRTLYSFEALAPMRRPRERGAEVRIREARLASRALAYLAPDFVVVHPVEALDAEEEVVLLEGTGLSTGFEATMHVPAYARWLEGQDQGPAYRHLRRCLGLLERRRRWVLKTPHHLEFLPDLVAAFPDVRLVWTHRDPAVTVPSFCSMVAHARGLVSDAVDPHDVGVHWLRKTSRMVERAEAFRAAHPEVPVLDVAYDALIGDPRGTLARVLDFAEVPTPPRAWRRLDAKLRASRRRGPSRHAYRAEDFGLSPAAIGACFPGRGERRRRVEA